jgi:lipopolysaccharide/colanic/teichoic acid biosynthesis glycosyltransferase
VETGLERAHFELESQEVIPGSGKVKRLFDFFGAALGLVTLLPLFLLIGLLIRFESPGPVFYGQVRIGRRAAPFKLWKFRSMVADSEERLAEHLDQNPELRLSYAQYQKLWRDPRLTGLGRILRRSSLDELPQLWNVLKGDMSLVGPRPCLPEQAVDYGPAFSAYISVRPGITGLWQVSGRNDLSFADRVRMDEEYIRRWSYTLDGIILIHTIGVVLCGEGAY